jgi:hypothetical protein
VDVATLRTDLALDEVTPAHVIAAIRLLVADFDGRPTTRVIGTGGRGFEFFPTAITDNIPPVRDRAQVYDIALAACHLGFF